MGSKVPNRKRTTIEPDAYLNHVAHKTIGAAIEVHKALGPGYLESVYEQALSHELDLHSIQHKCQHEISVNYKGYAVGQGRLDILVDDCLIVELKAVEKLLPIHKAQVISYLKATGLILGLLINFNVPILTQGIQRIVLS